jgi:hypothetical protein
VAGRLPISIGTFLNGESEPTGHGQPRQLRDGDHLRLDAYEIELRIAERSFVLRRFLRRCRLCATLPL